MNFDTTGDHSSFFQFATLSGGPLCPVQVLSPPHAQVKVARGHVAEPSLPASSNGQDLPMRAPRPLIRFFDRDFDTLQNLFRSHSIIECEEEGQVAYIDTWFVHHLQHPRCADPRAVKLFQDPASWLEDILAPWEDLIEENLDILLYLVRPTPPCTIMECLLAHVIIEQAPRPDLVAGLITTYDTGSERGALIDHTAWSLPTLMNANSVIRLVDFQVECRFRRCSVRRGSIPFGLFDFDEVEPGSGLIVYVYPPGHSAFAQGEESDPYSLLQISQALPADGIDAPRDSSNPPHSENFAFNPFAHRFCPGRHSHDLTPASVQELRDLWQRSVFSWEGEATVLQLVTWFVDQHTPALHACWRPRLVRLLDDAHGWERTLRETWHDLQLPGAPILIHVVQPSPPIEDEHTVAHVILIQNPQDEISSSLLTVFDTERTPDGIRLQCAMTTRAQLALEDIVTELGLSARCLSTDAPSICAAWIDTNILTVGRWTPVRDGSGILFQISRRPTVQEMQAHFGGLNLLQTSAHRKKGHRGRLTHGLVAHTHGPPAERSTFQDTSVPIRLLRAGNWQGLLPTFLEVTTPPSALKVQQELGCFGISCQPVLLSDDSSALIFPEHPSEEIEKNHFVYISQSEPFEIHLHSFGDDAAPDELDHMRHLYRLGFEKAVILSTISHAVGITEIVFTVSVGTLQSLERGPKPLPEWPRQQARRQPGPMLPSSTSLDSNQALCNWSGGTFRILHFLKAHTLYPL